MQTLTWCVKIGFSNVSNGTFTLTDRHQQKHYNLIYFYPVWSLCLRLWLTCFSTFKNYHHN